MFPKKHPNEKQKKEKSASGATASLARVGRALSAGNLSGLVVAGPLTQRAGGQSMDGSAAFARLAGEVRTKLPHRHPHPILITSENTAQHM